MRLVKILAILLVISSVLGLVSCFGGDDGPGYNEDVKPDEPNGNENSGTSNAINYTVTFDYNDGSGRTTTVKIPEGKMLDAYAPYPVDGTREVVAWSGTKDGVAYSAPVSSDITVYAQWQSFEVKVYTANIPDTVNDKFAEIDVSSNKSALVGKAMRIGAAVRSITLRSNGEYIDNFAIMLSDRSADLEITLDNFSFKSSQSFGIKANISDAYTVKIKLVGDSVIDCNSHKVVLGAGNAACISIGKLELYGGGKLTLIGANGEDGLDMPDAKNGQHGDNGTPGASGGCGIIANSLAVRNVSLTVVAGIGGAGGKGGAGNVANVTEGGEGGDGGAGGLGGDAIRVRAFKAEGSTLKLISGNGGNGGKGGKGGGGGLGFLGTYKEGGNGGKGGNGGYVFSSIMESFDAGDSITEYTAGDGGLGGSRGGGGTGFEGKNGTNGAKGQINAR